MIRIMVVELDMIITIAGLPGAGKTTAARALAKKLKMKFYSMGDLRGKMALERGLTIDKFNALPENTDIVVDRYQKKLGRTEDNFIVDGWASWHFIPKSFKIFLDVKPNVGAQRIFRDQGTPHRRDEPRMSSVAVARLVIAARVAHTRRRLKKYYGIDFLNKKNYDLVIDTSSKRPADVLKLILDVLKRI